MSVCLSVHPSVCHTCGQRDPRSGRASKNKFGPTVEKKNLSSCSLSFQKWEPLINYKKPSLMRSIGGIRTETENASHFCQTDIIVWAIVLEEMKLLNRCHTRDLSFQKWEPLINYKKPSLMGRIRTVTENASHFCQTDVIRLLCVKKWNFLIEIDAMRENWLCRHSQFSHILGGHISTSRKNIWLLKF